MKLYNLFEDIIFEEIGKFKGLITEGVSEDDVIKAMDGQYNVKIMYRGEGETTPKPRTIQIYVYGQLQSGDYGIRAYQVDGFSKKGNPHDWKILRLDRITSWQPTKMKWHKAVSDYNLEDDDMSKGGNVAKYNTNGDKKGNFIPGQSVNTFRRIIKQFGADSTQPTKPIGTPKAPSVAKPSVEKPSVEKPIVPTPTPKKQTPTVKPMPKPVAKPSPKPVAKPVVEPQVEPEVEPETGLDINEPNDLNKKKTKR